MKKYIFGLGILIVMTGCSSKMDTITKKIIKVETKNGSYHTVNRSSGAYGRYQIMPKTAKHYTKKLNIPHSQWKKPENQDKIYTAILMDNVNSLKKNGLDINAFNVYGCHQQGAYGFKCIMNNENMTEKSYKRLRRNIPSKYKYASNEQLRKIWINYWKNKMQNS